MTDKPLDARIAALFKRWFVRRPHGGCQVLFPLTELDGLVNEIMSVTIGCVSKTKGADPESGKPGASPKN